VTSIKRLMVAGMIVSLVFVLVGCGTKANVSKSSQTVNPPTAQSSTLKSASQQTSPSSDNTAPQQAQGHNINTSSAQGQAEIDQKIDQQLESLDKALDSLDKSSGNL